MSLTPIDFYSILYDIADSMPAQFDGNGNEILCSRLQTVAIVKDYGSEIQTTNLAKDVRYAGKKLFYSRQWLNAQQSPNAITWGYPALFVGEGDEVYRNGKQPYEIDFSFALSDRVEQKQSDTLNQSYCSQRTFEEVGQALRLTWQRILATLNDYVYARITIGANVSFVWITATAVAQLLSNGDIDSYDIEKQLSQYLGSSKARLSWDMHTEDAMTYFVQMPITFTACADVIPAKPQSINDAPKILPCC
jgi:hypothetical protein